jgi:hypothetical protein
MGFDKFKTFAQHCTCTTYINLSSSGNSTLETFSDEKAVIPYFPLTGLFQEMEANLVDWLDKCRAIGLPILNKDIKAVALELYQQWWDGLGVEGQGRILQKHVRMSVFTASDGWLSDFQKRHHISLRRKTHDSKKVPANADELVAQFLVNIQQQLCHFHPRQVTNIDEMFALFEDVGNHKGERQIDIKSLRGNPCLGCTVTLGISMDGSKLPVHITFRQPGQIAMREVEDNLPLNVAVTQSATGWMRADVMLHYLEEVFFPSMHPEEAQHDEYHPFLLLWDRCRVHLTEEVSVPIIQNGGVLELIPLGCSSIVQPLNVTIIHNFKAKLRVLWRVWKRENTNRDGDCPPISLLQVTQMIGTAWEQVPEQVVCNGFTAAGIGPGINDTDMIELLSDSEGANDNDEDGIEFLDLPEEDYDDQDNENEGQ